MSSSTNDICLERHTRIEEKLKEIDSRVDKLEQSHVSISQDIKYMSKDINSLVSIKKWELSLVVTVVMAVLGFLLQKVLFK